jgi:hypothetical protein
VATDPLARHLSAARAIDPAKVEAEIEARREE